MSLKYSYQLQKEMRLSLKLNLQDDIARKCPYSQFFWSVYSRIRTEYGERENTENADQKNSKYEQFSRSVKFQFYINCFIDIIEI